MGAFKPLSLWPFCAAAIETRHIAQVHLEYALGRGRPVFPSMTSMLHQEQSCAQKT